MIRNMRVAYRTGAPLAATLGLAALAWVVTVRQMHGMDMGVATQLGSFAFFVALWAVMMAAMMLPGLVPAVLSRGRRTGPVRAVVPFVASYLVVWTLVGALLYALYRPHGTTTAGLVVIAAGLYELTRFKQHCRRCCRARTRSGGGLEFGLYCVGPSIGLMVMLDALGAEGRALPMVAIEKEYISEGTHGRRTLAALFGKQRQLVVYHFMFGLPPEWEDEGCPACSYVVDNLSGSLVHLAARDSAFAAVSRAPFAKINPFKQRMGWTFPWLSSFGTDFNEDFGVTLDKTHTVYNYAPVSAQPEARPHEGEREGLSVFFRDGKRVFHTYSTYQRGLDHLLNTYNLLDLAPLGRREEEGIMHWLKYHVRY